MRNKDQGKSQKISQEALRLFLKKGPRSVSMADIAKACGLAVGTLYLYFKDKPALASECLSQHFKNHQAHSKELLSRSSDARAQTLVYLKRRFDSHKQLRTGNGSAEFCRYVLEFFPDVRQREAELLAQTLTQALFGSNEEKKISLRNPDQDVRVFLLSLTWFFPLPTDENRAEPKWSLCEKTIHWFFDLWETPPKLKS